MRLRGAGPALLGVALLLTACGSDDADDPAAVAPTAEEEDRDDDHEHEDDHDHEDESGETLGATEVDAPVTRLLVADGEAGEVAVVEPGTGEVIEVIDIPAPEMYPTMLATTEGDRYGFAVMPDRDLAQAIDVGVWSVDHGDHFHYYVAAPAQLAEYPGGGPSHVVTHSGQTAIFFDDDGEFQVLSAADIAQGAEGTVIATDAPHHGVAVPWGEDRFIASAYGDTDPDDTTLPPEVVVQDADGEVVESGFPECPGLHGEVALGDTVAFACADGIVVLEEHGDHFDGHKLEYPDDDGRSGTLRTASGLDVLVGNYSAEAMLVIDPAEHEVTLVDLPDAFSTFAVSAYDDGRLLGMSADGTLHAVALDSGEITSVASVTEAYDEDAEWSDPTPQVAVGGGALVYVTDPAAGQVHEVDLDGEAVTQSLDVGGTPFHVAAFGG
ncbi:hypothetical protein [Phytoactinopolyspora mesophila]|uniref:PQQ-binding-like beta-propeller repeat protein n=1 Tax=Phytoactinopolyspora mesophila TaxID=2650750 RepID=A0A7K3MAX4_9ACTN|nr:hypothetical protein [Phytoactinopolyspora mesophila]NDL60465.1 hypothetical protein [Phytoactinopolyspora mesophila]